MTGVPSPMSTAVLGPEPNRSICCHSRVGSSSASGPIRAEKIFLFKYSANRNSVLHSGEASQFDDNRQITASHRVLACRNASFQRTPDRIPLSRSRSRKISLAKGGS